MLPWGELSYATLGELIKHLFGTHVFGSDDVALASAGGCQQNRPKFDVATLHENMVTIERLLQHYDKGGEAGGDTDWIHLLKAPKASGSLDGVKVFLSAAKVAVDKFVKQKADAEANGKRVIKRKHSATSGGNIGTFAFAGVGRAKQLKISVSESQRNKVQTFDQIQDNVEDFQQQFGVCI